MHYFAPHPMSTASAQAPDRALWSATLQPGEHWSTVLRRGVSLRLTALAPGANVAALLYNYECPVERYNMADTLKAQHIAYLTSGCVCYSDMGRVLCSITSDSCGWHDTICGLSDADSVAAQFGATRFQERRNDTYKNGRDSMLDELGKWGMGRRDLVANINFFSRVTAEESGALRFDAQHCRAGDHVELRFEMHTLLLLANCPHPLDPAREYRPSPIELSARLTGPAPAHDACRERCGENARGLHNTEMMFLPWP